MKPLKRRELEYETSWLSMRLSVPMHEKIRDIAFKEGKTVSYLITEILEAYLKQRDEAVGVATPKTGGNHDNAST